MRHKRISLDGECPCEKLEYLDAVVCNGGDRRVGAVSDGEGVHAGRAVKLGEGGVGEVGDGGGSGRVGEVYDLDAIICTGGDRRVGAACDGEGVHAACAVKIGDVSDAGEGWAGRVGEVNNTDTVSKTGIGGDHRVGAACDGEGVHVPCAVKKVGGEAGGGGWAGRVGEVYNLDAAFFTGGDHRVGAVSDGEGVHAPCAVKHHGGAVVGEAADGGGAGRVGEVDDLDAVI